MLFHVSDVGGIPCFEPRESGYTADPVVWAIHEDRLHNYLVPRDCPRVTFYADPDTTKVDRERFLGSSRAVVAVESDWYDQLQSCRLYLYQMPSEPFVCHDQTAGYYVSHSSVEPLGCQVIENSMVEILRRGVELRFLPSLWELHDAVAASSLQFSMIRMRNARPRTMLMP